MLEVVMKKHSCLYAVYLCGTDFKKYYDVEFELQEE
jgi:hypothetical protein